MKVLFLLIIPLSGCGDYVTKSDFEAAESAQQARIRVLETQIDSLEREQSLTRGRISLVESDIDALEAVFESDVVINTRAHTRSAYWEMFGGTINTETSWRYLEVDGGEIRGGYSTTWTNNTKSDISVTRGRLVFEDAIGIQIGEYKFGILEQEFDLDGGASRVRTGNFEFFASVSAANQVTRMSIWAGFAER